MTAGTVVVLGPVGRNFAAGMSGGLAFVWDPERKLDALFNSEMVSLESITDAEESAALKSLVARHAEVTASPHAATLVKRWDKAVGEFRRITPLPSAGVTPQVFRYQVASIA
jgi:glutamate synthase (NADPH/NADH) large chain